MRRDGQNRVAFCYLDNAGLRRGPLLTRRLVIKESPSVERQYEGRSEELERAATSAPFPVLEIAPIETRALFRYNCLSIQKVFEKSVTYSTFRASYQTE